MSKKVVKDIKEIEKYLRKIDYIIRVEGRAIINQLNITIPQFTALQILINHGNMTIGQLSQRMALACSTVTDLVDRMEKNQLVVRKKDKNDGRLVIVEPLPKGHEILEQVLIKRREFLGSMLVKLDKEEVDQLRHGLESLYKIMDISEG
ncbi:MAG TPA: MarR family transcriptional regulator [Tissierellaceae bacterium]|nr:MarR family transcriptional regulator [Tissierellaceae bacterium]